MLVLTRKLNEQIKIGNDITITVIKLRNNQIRLGIEAPRDVRVLRAELEKRLNASEFTLEASAMQDGTSDGADDEAAQLPSRIDVIDGLVSADEMIAAGMDNDDDGNGGGCSAEATTDGTRSPRLQVFSGKIGVDGELRENKPSRSTVNSARAPLAAYFTAP